MNQNNLINKRVAFCMVCGECLGEYVENCAEEHIKKYPTHDDFLVKKIVDPLLLPNLDEWLSIRNSLIRNIASTDFEHKEDQSSNEQNPKSEKHTKLKCTTRS